MSVTIVKILFFGKARDFSSLKEDILSVQTTVSYDDLLSCIVNRYSLSLLQNNLILAVNERYCQKGDQIILKEGDIIAVIPPLSGDVNRIASSPECGAISLFVGTTRNNNDGKMVTKLTYEAYESMALKIMEFICDEIKQKWPDVRNVVIHHRLGEVNVGEVSVVIAISSPHRKDSLEAVQFAIEKLKQTVPIFKKEVYKNYPAEWKENKECVWSER